MEIRFKKRGPALAQGRTWQAMAGGYSLWFMPTGRLYKRLAALILRLSTEYSTPTFEPHVTLIGDISLGKDEARDRTAILAKQLRPTILMLGNVGYTSEYYRSLFIKVELTKALKEARQAAKLVFNQRSHYAPHLSLMYGRLNVGEKQEIISRIGNRFDFQFKPNKIHLVSASSKASPQEWHRMFEFKLCRSTES